MGKAGAAVNVRAARRKDAIALDAKEVTDFILGRENCTIRELCAFFKVTECTILTYVTYCLPYIYEYPYPIKNGKGGRGSMYKRCLGVNADIYFEWQQKKKKATPFYG